MKKILPVLLLIFFLIPFSFFALWFDIQFHSMWGYALSLLVTCLLGIAFFFLKSPTLFGGRPLSQLFVFSIVWGVV